MKGIRKKQLLAWGLAAGMIVSNLGTAFAAYNVGTAGNAAKDEVLSVTLNAEGGSFTITPSGSNAEELKVVDVEAKAGKADGSNYYAQFGDFKLASGSNAEKNFVTEGPSAVPANQPNAKFDGWYGKLEDLSTKLTADSRVYSYAEVYARWVEQVKEIPAELEKDVQNVETSGLTDVTISTIKDVYQENQIRQDINKIALGGGDADYSYQLLSTPVLLDISANLLDAASETPGMITMKIPESLEWSKAEKDDIILVMHFEDYGTELKEEPQKAIVDETNGTMTFRAGSFSPYAIVRAKDNGAAKTAKVKVENVRGGGIIACNVNEEGKMMFLPIGEEVEIPLGTELQFGYFNKPMNDGYARLTGNKNYGSIVTVITNNVPAEYSLYEGVLTITGDTVITAEFVAEKSSPSSRKYRWSVEPAGILESGEYMGTIEASERGEDGKWQPLEGIYAELAKPQYPEYYNNDEFTVEGTVIKSKGKLEAGRYDVALNIFKADGTQIIGMNPDGSFNNDLTPGVHTITVGVNGYFQVKLVEYEYADNSSDRWRTMDGYQLGNTIVKKDSSFDDAYAQVLSENEITGIGMFGYENAGINWVDMKNRPVDTTKKLDKDYYDFIACFEGYKAPKVLSLDEADLKLELDGSNTMKPEETRTIKVAGTDAAKVTNVDWKSSDDSVASVEASEDIKTATITAAETGEAEITATVTLTLNGKETTCVLTQAIVVNESGESEDPDIKIDIYGASHMEVGATQVLSLTGTSKPEVKAVTWKSSAPSVVKVEENDDMTAKVTAIAEGKATITATVTVATEQGEKAVTRSKEITVQKNDTPNPGENGGNSGSGYVKPAKGGSSSGNSTAGTSTGWTRDSRGWRLLAKDGSLIKGQWSQIDNVWYYFGADGYMMTGWQFINGKWYYLTETENGMGAMTTGWHQDNASGIWYFMGADGAMLTGWQLINGVWYYLNPGPDGTVGAMAVNTQIGDYYVGADGAWVQ